MNDWLEQEKAAKTIKEKYKEGDKLLVNYVDDAVYIKYIGQVVTVRSIDDLGHIKCVAENGGTLTLCQFYGDSFEKIELEIVKREIDENGNELYVEWSNGDWAKGEFNAEGDRTYYENSDGFWEKYKYDDRGNQTYIENSNGFWVKSEYDENDNETYWENSHGAWTKSEYDDHGNETYLENSTGEWVRREYDENGHETYYEDSNGSWAKSQYDENGNRTYYEDSDSEKRGTPRAKYILDGKEYTADELRIGYRITTGLNNDAELTDDEIYSYMLEQFELDERDIEMGE